MIIKALVKTTVGCYVSIDTTEHEELDSEYNELLESGYDDDVIKLDMMRATADYIRDNMSVEYYMNDTVGFESDCIEIEDYDITDYIDVDIERVE